MLTENSMRILRSSSLGRSGVILHSRGGKLGMTEARNPEYNSALRLILQRMALLGAVLDDVVVVSARALRTHPNATERRLPLEFPIQLKDVRDLEELRLKICRAQSSVARSTDARSSQRGNPTRAIKL